MIIKPENYDRVVRVLVQSWWYDVLPGTFANSAEDGADPEYTFDYRPSGRVFGTPPRTMQTSCELVDSVQYEGRRP